MQAPNTYSQVYFLGIGGIGMSSLARYCISEGKCVAGYDLTETKLTELLSKEGASIHYQDDIQLIPLSFTTLSSKENTLIVYTPAVPILHTEYNWFIDQGYTVVKRAEFLAEVSKDKYCVAVAGTHGKTSTCACISYLLTALGIDHYAFLGGITANSNSNFIRPSSGAAQIVVVEADEFDRSFLQLSPDIAIITSVEPDHLDIYGDAAGVIDAFDAFSKRVKDDGTLIIHDLAMLPSLTSLVCNVLKYGTKTESELSVANVCVHSNRFQFDYTLLGNKTVQNVVTDVAGNHNILNACAAILAVYTLDKNKLSNTLSPNEISSNLENFHGVYRRFQTIVQNNDLVLIDDYAHHPTEIEAAILTVKKLYLDQEILVVFQPHLFSRTRDFAEGFAKALDLADKIILLPIYPARELPIAGVTSQIIADLIPSEKVQILEKDKLFQHLSNTSNRVIVTLGAGDIDKLVQPIAEHLTNLKRAKKE